MKPLILTLLVSLSAVGALAQTGTIADVARQERARRERSKATVSFTTADIRGKSGDDAAEAKPPNAVTAPETPAAAATPAGATAAPAANAAAPAAPGEPDSVAQWTEETTRLRAKVRDLMDQETTAQLQVNTITNQIFAPVSTQTARDQAQLDLQTAQQKLQTIRADLTISRGELQARELQGPPRR